MPEQQRDGCGVALRSYFGLVLPRATYMMFLCVCTYILYCACYSLVNVYRYTHTHLLPLCLAPFLCLRVPLAMLVAYVAMLLSAASRAN